MKKLTILCICLIGMFGSKAQTNKQYSDKDYAKKPLWINMMADTSVNFFEIEKAYNTYWQHHTMPATEHDVIGEKAEREKHPSKRMLRKMDADNDMRMAVKKYEWWCAQMKPYVQDDGRILTPTERLKIWEQQQNEKDKAQTQNNK